MLTSYYKAVKRTFSNIKINSYIPFEAEYPLAVEITRYFLFPSWILPYNLQQIKRPSTVDHTELSTYDFAYYVTLVKRRDASSKLGKNYHVILRVTRQTGEA